MNWSDVGRVVGNAAPTLGALLGGPAGGAVGALIASALGTSSDPDAVNAALAADPSALAKVQELQINAKVQLQQLAVTAEMNRLQAEGAQYAAEVADRDSARKLAAAQPRDFIRPVVTMTVLLGSMVIVVAIFAGWAREILVDPTASLTVGTVIGLWFSLVKEVMGFWFGMTKESQKQTAAITEFAVAPGSVSSEKGGNK